MMKTVFVLSALLFCGAVQAQDQRLPAADPDGRVYAAGMAFLAQLAPLFCPHLTSDTAAIRAYEGQHHFEQADLLEGLAASSVQEFSAFQQQFVIGRDVPCNIASEKLGEHGLKLITTR